MNVIIVFRVKLGSVQRSNERILVSCVHIILQINVKQFEILYRSILYSSQIFQYCYENLEQTRFMSQSKKGVLQAF